MKVLAVAGVGLALIGIGVAVPGVLSTILIASGGLFVLGSPLALLFRREREDESDQFEATASDTAVASKTTGDSSPIAVSSGSGSIDQSRRETHNYYGQESQKATPAIVFKDPELSEATLKAPPQFPGSIGIFLVFPVANDPPPGVVCEPAEHVHATITIYDDDRGLLVPEMTARWQDKPQPMQVGPYEPVGSAALTEETLNPNGASHGIDSVVWLRREDEIYVWHQGGIGPRIKRDAFTIELRVRGSNVDELRSYRVSKSGNPFMGIEASPLGKVMAPAAAHSHPATSNPWSHASYLQRTHEQQELRKYLRIIGEDELQLINRPRLISLIERRTTSMLIATAQWSLHHEHLRSADDPRPYRDAAAAYRELADLSEALRLDGRNQPLSESEIEQVERTLRAVEQAVFTLRQADQ